MKKSLKNWLLLQPTLIIDVHPGKYKSHVLVKYFRVTDKGKIKRWLGNREKLKTNYNIFRPSHDGKYSITLWDMGAGYQELKRKENTLLPNHDLSWLLCFDDMKVKENCTDKENWLMDISQNREGKVYIDVKGATYRQTKNGFERLKKDSTFFK